VCALVPKVHEVIARVLKRLPSNWDAVFLGYHGGTLIGTGSGGKDTAEEDARARFELNIDEGRGWSDGFVGSVDGDIYCGHGVYDPSLLRMYMPLYGLYAWIVRKEAAMAALEGSFPIHGQVDHALSQWLVSERGRTFRVSPRQLLFFSPKSEHGLDSDVQSMARLEELLDDPEMTQRYMDFVNSDRFQQ